MLRFRPSSLPLRSPSSLHHLVCVLPSAQQWQGSAQRRFASAAPAAAQGSPPARAARGTAQAKAAIISLNQRLLDFIAVGDWEGYSSLCCPSLSCFEAEARGAFVQGLAFHKIYYDRGDIAEDRRAYMSEPHVRFLAGGRVAVLSYVRLVQKYLKGQGHSTVRVEETRVWEKKGTNFLLVHFHKSDLLK